MSWSDGSCSRRRVWEVAQEDELRRRIGIGEIVQLQALELTPCVMDIRHERGHDDGGSALVRDGGFEIELRQQYEEVRAS